MAVLWKNTGYVTLDQQGALVSRLTAVVFEAGPNDYGGDRQGPIKVNCEHSWASSSWRWHTNPFAFVVPEDSMMKHQNHYPYHYPKHHIIIKILKPKTTAFHFNGILPRSLDFSGVYA